MSEVLRNRKRRQAKKNAKKKKQKVEQTGLKVPSAKLPVHIRLYEGLLDIAALDTRTCIDPKRIQGRPKAAAAKLASQQIMFALGVDLTAVYRRIGNLCKLVRMSAVD
jgi:hypothetical protein